MVVGHRQNRVRAHRTGSNNPRAEVYLRKTETIQIANRPPLKNQTKNYTKCTYPRTSHYCCSTYGICTNVSDFTYWKYICTHVLLVGTVIKTAVEKQKGEKTRKEKASIRKERYKNTSKRRRRVSRTGVPKRWQKWGKTTEQRGYSLSSMAVVAACVVATAVVFCEC